MRFVLRSVRVCLRKVRRRYLGICGREPEKSAATRNIRCAEGSAVPIRGRHDGFRGSERQKSRCGTGWHPRTAEPAPNHCRRLLRKETRGLQSDRPVATIAHAGAPWDCKVCSTASALPKLLPLDSLVPPDASRSISPSRPSFPSSMLARPQPSIGPAVRRQSNALDLPGSGAIAMNPCDISPRHQRQG